MIIEGIIIGGVLALLGAFGALTVTVYRMSGVIENGLTGEMKDLAKEVKAMAEEQIRQGARLDTLTKRWVD